MRTLPFTWPCSLSSSFKPTLLISLPKLLSFPYTIVGTSCSSFYRHFSLSFSFFLINKSTLSFFIIYKIKPCILVFSISKVFNIIWISEKMENSVAYQTDLNLKATELRLGLPGTEETLLSVSVKNNKRPLIETSKECDSKSSNTDAAPPSK